jgi:hypothetical protein
VQQVGNRSCLRRGLLYQGGEIVELRVPGILRGQGFGHHLGGDHRLPEPVVQFARERRASASRTRSKWTLSCLN